MAKDSNSEKGMSYPEFLAYKLFKKNGGKFPDLSNTIGDLEQADINIMNELIIKEAELKAYADQAEADAKAYADQADAEAQNALGELATLDTVAWGYIDSTLKSGNYFKANLIHTEALLVGSGAEQQTLIYNNYIRTDYIQTEALKVGEDTLITSGAVNTNLINTEALKVGNDTLITNGYLRTSLIKADDLQVKAANISGTLSIGAIPTTAKNSSINISSNGTLNGAGGGRVSLSGLGAGVLATLNYVEKARLGNTIIDGGYIKTDLLNADTLIARDVFLKNSEGLVCKPQVIKTTTHNTIQSSTNDAVYYTNMIPISTFENENYHTDAVAGDRAKNIRVDLISTSTPISSFLVSQDGTEDFTIQITCAFYTPNIGTQSYSIAKTLSVGANYYNDRYIFTNSLSSIDHNASFRISFHKNSSNPNSWVIKIYLEWAFTDNYSGNSDYINVWGRVERSGSTPTVYIDTIPSAPTFIINND